MASSQSSSCFLSPVLHYTRLSRRLVCLEDLFYFPPCLDFVGEEKKLHNIQHVQADTFPWAWNPGVPGSSLPQEAVVGIGQGTLCWGDGGQRMFNSHACVINCPLCHLGAQGRVY